MVDVLGKALVVLGLMTASLYPTCSYLREDSVVTRINETVVKRYGDEDKYLIFTDAGVFENTDAWYRLKFRSSDLQAKIMELKGEEVEITKYGWRFPPFSWYENIIAVEEVK